MWQAFEGEGISGGGWGGGLGAQERDGNIKKKGEECRKEARADTFGQCAAFSLERSRVLFPFVTSNPFFNFFCM